RLHRVAQRRGPRVDVHAHVPVRGGGVGGRARLHARAALRRAVVGGRRGLRSLAHVQIEVRVTAQEPAALRASEVDLELRLAARDLDLVVLPRAGRGLARAARRDAVRERGRGGVRVRDDADRLARAARRARVVGDGQRDGVRARRRVRVARARAGARAAVAERPRVARDGAVAVRRARAAEARREARPAVREAGGGRLVRGGRLRDLVAHGADADRVDRADLVVVRLAVRDRRVRVARDDAQRLVERFRARGRGAQQAVARDGGAAVVGRGPRERDLAVARRARERGGGGGRRARGRGGRGGVEAAVAVEVVLARRAEVLRGGLEARVDLRVAPRGVERLQQRGDARDVRRGHARAAHRRVGRAAARVGGEDVDARRRDVDLGALRGEAREDVVAVRRGDDDDLARALLPRVAHAVRARARVARGGDEHDALRDGVVERVADRRVRARRAPRVAADLDALVAHVGQRVRERGGRAAALAQDVGRE